MTQAASVQRSFRLSPRTSELLDDLVDVSNESRNSLVERILAEALRTERHPLIKFRAGAAGRREPIVVGTRLLVRQLVQSAREEGGAEDAAMSLEINVEYVRAALSYYADFADEVDADEAWANRAAQEEHEHWMREQAFA